MVTNLSTLVRLWLTTSLALPFVEGQCSGTTTISTGAEATALAVCGTFDGDVEVARFEGEVSLTGLNEVTGDLSALVIDDLTALTADSLHTVRGELYLRGAGNLATISLPVLRNIGSLYLIDLPSLRVLDAGEDGFTNVSSITISSTSLQNLNWLRLDKVQDLILLHNSNMTDVTLGGLSLIEGSLTLNNERWVRSKWSAPDLESAYDVNVIGSAAVSLPLLSQVNRSIWFSDNSFQRLELAMLTTVSGDVIISHNPELTTVAFPKLGLVGGDISANGSFSEFNMPSLLGVQGDVIIVSDVPFDCAAFDTYNEKYVLQGQYICDPGASGSGGLSTGAKAGIAVGVIAGVGILTVMAFLLLRRKKRLREAHSLNTIAVTGAGKEIDRTLADVATTSNGANEYTKPELSAESAPRPPTELHGDSSTRLMDTNSNTTAVEGDAPRFELPASSPAHER